MSTRRSLGLPITLGVVLIVLVVAVLVGWVLLSMFGAWGDPSSAWLFWTMLAVGAVILVTVLLGVVMYLVLSIQAVNLNRRQTNFIDSITHELKSPITSLKLYLQTMARRNVSEQEREKFHRFMLDDVERLDALINHLLDAGRLERGTMAGEIVDVELAELLRQCAASVCLRYRLDPESIALDVSPGIVRARQVDLEMIFRNLIDNAVKYAGSPPQVRVTLVSKSAEEIVVRIADNGRGIPRQLREKIFGRFVRLGSELERNKPGTGLGLYIVRTLVHRLRGRIRVGDVEHGSGTVFEVQLPGRAVASSSAVEGNSQATNEPPVSTKADVA